MNRYRSYTFILFFVVAISAGYAQKQEGKNTAATSPQQKKSWSVEGVMSEACQCAVFCPCEFMSVPTFGHCDDAAILHIEKGHYGDVKLDGQRIAVVSQSREGKRLVDTVGDLAFGRIYIPAQATEAQANALAEIARRVFGAFVKQTARISPDEKVEKVNMQVMIEPHRHRVQIPKILDLDLETIAGGDGTNPIVIQNNPFTAAGFGEVLVAQSKAYKYTHNGNNWDYSGRSASIRTFKLSGEI